METVLNKLENCEVEVKVTFSADEWKAAQTKALNKLARNVKIDGFRQGKAPMKLVKARIGNALILEEATDMILRENYAAILTNNNVNPVAQPEIQITELTAEVFSCSVKCVVAPEVELTQYKGLEVKKAGVKVTKKEIEERLTDYQNQFASLVLKEEGTVENGDTAVIDFEGFKDGVAFEGGKGENHPLEIGSGSFIPGFEDQVIGMAVNEEKEINVTFPADYHAEDLAGAAVTFKVKVHEIKTKVLPEIDDELAMDANIDGVETLEQLQAHIKEEIRTRKQNEAENKFNEELVTALINANEFTVPSVMVDSELEKMVGDIQNNLQQQGISLDLYLQFLQKTPEEFKEGLKGEAERRVKYNLILAAVVKAENIVITDEDVDTELAEIAKLYNMEFDTVKDMFKQQLGYVKEDLALRKASELIKDNVK